MTETTHHLTHLSTSKRLFIRIMGPIYAFAFRTNYQKLLGIPHSLFVKWLPIWLGVAILILRWPLLLFWMLLGTAVFIRILYFVAYRSGYSRFVADPKPHPLPTEISLPAGKRIPFRATGLFAVTQREERVFLRPAEFWQIPLGERAMIVKAPNELYLYQFFTDETLTKVEPGWLVFGSEPLPSIAITFCSMWGPSFKEGDPYYYVGDAPEDGPCQSRQVILTFEDPALMAQVESNLSRA